jgi:hypothetical protein
MTMSFSQGGQLCLPLVFIAAAVLWPAGSCVAQRGTASASQFAAPAVRLTGTVKAISGNTITLAADSGSEVTVLVQDGARLLRVAPGQKDLKDAKPIQLTDMQPGDRILARGTAGVLANSIVASSVVAIAQSELAARQARDREEWQKRGVGGLVVSIDAVGGSIAISTAALADKKNVIVRVLPNTILRRYAADSVKFDDAKPAPIDSIKAGDQLRARGARSEDGSELKADEVVSGTFRNIAGTVFAIDAAAGTLMLQDLATSKTVTVRITPESQLRKLPPPFAQRIAMRLKGIVPDAPGAASPSSDIPLPPAAVRAGRLPAAGSTGTGRSVVGPPDFQQMISRMPPATLADLQKGDAVMLVATEGTSVRPSTVITLLGGVEPILEASPKSAASTILSPWSLSTPAEGGATP